MTLLVGSGSGSGSGEAFRLRLRLRVKLFDGSGSGSGSGQNVPAPAVPAPMIKFSYLTSNTIFKNAKCQNITSSKPIIHVIAVRNGSNYSRPSIRSYKLLWISDPVRPCFFFCFSPVFFRRAVKCIHFFGAFAKCLLNFGLRPDRPAGIRHR